MKKHLKPQLYLVYTIFNVVILTASSQVEPTPGVTGLAPIPEDNSELILDFTQGKLPITFFNLNDGVMGGVSTGTITYDPIEEAGRFFGTTLTDNNGGFSSVRSATSKSLASPGKQGIRLVVKGDGKIYRVSFTMANQNRPSYNHDFDTVDGEYISVELYFKDFIPQVIGFVLTSAPILDSSLISRLGFYHSKFSMYGSSLPGWVEGDFEMFIKSVEYF
eukprot:TRINITY_DN3820_c0_g1_i2.p1 TRINITY_DN3820_c0_g1~~TRINITY_DN3820_c0_g1_i2.p1  ORF type:complete len:254 (-),score=16.15 TRINITY_DN3820_c0_g1_i2:216-872(-)